MRYDAMKAALTRRRNELLAARDQGLGGLEEERRAREPDWTDQAAQESEASRERQVDDVELTELQAIEAALARFEEGIYGLCTSCGEGIDPQRLSAVPEARYCVECAEREERGRR